MINVIVAITADNAIGQNNQLIHHDPIDMKRFRDLTTNHVVIMGRKTYDSLPNGPLPNRVNYIVSNTLLGDFTIFSNLKSAISSAQTNYPDKEVFIIGGESIYRQAFEADLVDRAYITHFDCLAPKADAYFPFSYITDWKSLWVDDYITSLTPTCGVTMEFSIWTKL